MFYVIEDSSGTYSTRNRKLAIREFTASKLYYKAIGHKGWLTLYQFNPAASHLSDAIIILRNVKL